MSPMCGDAPVPTMAVDMNPPGVAPAADTLGTVEMPA
jgi:hypothetical protein